MTVAMSNIEYVLTFFKVASGEELEGGVLVESCGDFLSNPRYDLNVFFMMDKLRELYNELNTTGTVQYENFLQTATTKTDIISTNFIYQKKLTIVKVLMEHFITWQSILDHYAAEAYKESALKINSVDEEVAATSTGEIALEDLLKFNKSEEVEEEEIKLGMESSGVVIEEDDSEDLVNLGPIAVDIESDKEVVGLEELLAATKTEELSNLSSPEDSSAMQKNMVFEQVSENKEELKVSVKEDTSKQEEEIKPKPVKEEVSEKVVKVELSTAKEVKEVVGASAELAVLGQTLLRTFEHGEDIKTRFGTLMHFLTGRTPMDESDMIDQKLFDEFLEISKQMPLKEFRYFTLRVLKDFWRFKQNDFVSLFVNHFLDIGEDD